jgi:hypothetical protein
MPAGSVRDLLVEALTFPAGWAVIPEQRIPGTLSQTTVILKHSRIEKLDEAPIGHLRNTVTLTVVDPHTDQSLAENELDDAVLALITSLDGHPWINWSLAEKVAVRDPYIGWDVTLTVVTQKPTPTEEP